MSSIEFPAYVKIDLPPKTLKVFACRAGALLTALAAAAGIALGMRVSVFVFLLVFYLLRAGKEAQVSSELKVVKARLAVEGDQVELYLPASLCCGGLYVDQRFRADLSRGCSVTVGEKGEVVVRARSLAIELVDRDLSGCREIADGEVLLTLVSDEAKRDLRRFVEDNGLRPARDDRVSE